MTLTPPRQTDQARQKVDRDEVFLEYTKSICPVCKTVIDAEVNVKDNRVFMRKRCKEHGQFEALLYGDAQMYFDSLRFNKPGTIPLETQTEIVDGCPLDCGLCPDHKQHACLGILEVNTNCNLDCPICFADSGHQPDGFSLTMEQAGTAIDAFVRSEGEPEVLMFSGGEPTIHPEILDFMQLALDRGVRTVNLNTNGIKLAHDRTFVEKLTQLTRKPNIYMQFDGFNERTHLDIRGRDLRNAKQKALDNCAEFGLTVTLVAAIEAGLNEHEMGEIVKFGVEHPAVRSVAYQPVTHSGRHVEFDPMERLTNAEIVKGLAAQVPEWFRVSDFFPVPCCFPTCRSITYLLIDGDNVVPIPRLINIEDYLDYVSNRVMPDMDIRHALEKLWSATAAPGTEMTAEQLECAVCGIDLPEALKDLTEQAFMIVIQDFQDPYTLNVKQLMKCCVEEITPDGRLIPFCAYNSVGYREEIREQLSGVAMPTLVPNSGELQPILLTTKYGSKTYGNGDRNGHTPANATNVGNLGDVTVVSAAEQGVSDRVRFHLGDAERIPLPDASVDAIVCECAFCTFPDKATAAAEMARVLKPGGKVGITDVALDPARLDAELQTLAGWVACIADARPVAQYVELLADAGLTVTLTESHDDALAAMVDQIDARLRAFRMAKVPALADVDFDVALDRTALAARAVADGIAGYSLLVAEKG